MLLSDYIKGSYSNNRRIGFLQFYNEKFEAEWLNNVNIPNPDLILQHQKQIFMAENGISSMQYQSDPILNALNKDISNNKSEQIDYFKNLDKNIQKIETYVDSLGGGKTEEEMIQQASILDSNIHDLDSLLEAYQNFISELGEMENMNEVRYAFYPIYNRLQALENYAKSIASGQNNVPWPGTQDGFLKRITWTEYALKGQYLEIVGTDFFKQRFPNNIVLNTGSLKGYYDIFGTFKNTGKMKEDLMILKKENFSISFTIGNDSQIHEMSILEFINWLDKNKDTKDIRLTEYGYQQLQQHLIAGVQAKATRSNRIKFGNINLNTANKDEKGKALALLGEIYLDDPSTPSPLKKSHEHYEMLFNYNLAHNINHVIGKNNKLLLTRTGVYDMYSFILEQFNNGRYFYAVKGSVQLDHLKRGLKIALDFIDK